LQKKPLDTSKNYAFWSGKPAHTYAESHGYAVLEGQVIGKIFDKVNTVFGNEWPVMKTLWRAISDVYAEKIADIMKGKKIHVFQRKQGDVFKDVEQPAVKRVFDKARTIPEYMFHPLITDGVFGGDGMFDKPKSNPYWRQELKTAAKGDEPKAKAAAEAQHVRIFDYPGEVPEGKLVDKGAAPAPGAAKAVIDANDDAVLAGCETAKKNLEKKTTAGV